MKKATKTLMALMLVLGLCACSSNKEPHSKPQEETTQKTETKKEEKKEESVVEQKEEPVVQQESGIRTDFKEAMDSYEAFMEEYVEFMILYQSTDNPTVYLAQYAEYMTKYADCMAKFEKWDDEDLTQEETVYYIEVQTRVNQKLLEVSQY